MSSKTAEGATRYSLSFKVSALKEWDALVGPVKEQLHKKLSERLDNPRVERDKLSGQGNKDRYKIKLRASGYRLVYQVYDTELIVEVIAVGKRERGEVYGAANRR